MPMNFAEPAVTQNYSTQFVPAITNAFTALAQMLDPAVSGTITGTPTGAYRINGVNLERFNGSVWSTYTLNIAGSAAQVGGFAPAANTTAAAANELVRASSDAVVYIGRLSSNTANTELASPAQFVTNNGTDQLYRRSSAAQAAAAIQAAASGSWAISITGAAGSVAWTSVTGRPTALSAFTNDAGYITSATTVAGLAPSASGATVGANELVRSDASGNTFLNRFSTAVANSNLASPAQFLTTVGTDNIVGKSSAAQVAAVLQAAASGSWAISITGNAATASSVAWTNVSGRPTAVSAFTNDSGYLGAAGVAALANSAAGVGAIRMLFLLGGSGVYPPGTNHSSSFLRTATSTPAGWGDALTAFKNSSPGIWGLGAIYNLGGGTPASDLPAGQVWVGVTPSIAPYTDNNATSWICAALFVRIS